MPISVQPAANTQKGAAVPDRAASPSGPVSEGMSFDSSQRLNTEQVEALDSLFRRFDRIRVFAHGAVGDLAPATLTRKSFGDDPSPLLIEGILARVQFEKDGMLLIPRLHEDSFGNRYERFGGRGGRRGMVAHVEAGFADVSTQHSVDLDLKRFGLPSLSGVFIDRTAREVKGVDGPLRVFVLGSENPVDAQTAEMLVQVGEGAKLCAAYFGIPDAVDRILYLNDPRRNAWFESGNESTIAVLSGVFAGAPIEPRLVGMHETAHLIDSRTGGRLSGFSFGAIQRDMSSSLSPEDGSGLRFLSEINERRFFEQQIGGHAEDNSRELFASAVSSLMHPRWHDRVALMSDESARAYLACLRRIQQQLGDSNMFPEDAIVFDDLKRKIHALGCRTEGANGSYHTLSLPERPKSD